MTSSPRILVFQTAFIGDVVLTLPTVQTAVKLFPGARITFVAIPAAAELLRNHPAIAEIVPYDKRGSARGIRGALALARRLREGNYDVALVPHRSMRSALIVWWSRIPRRIGFSTSAGRVLFTDVIPYDPSVHEMLRNADLLGPLGMAWRDPGMPAVYPSQEDRRAVDALLGGHSGSGDAEGSPVLVAIAPGSVWATKRWPESSFAALALELESAGATVVLVGGEADRELCERICSVLRRGLVAAGRLTLLQSAELLRRCRVVVSNDSAPVHLAAGVGAPVVAIFGATSTAFGFAPRGPRDVVVETHGLPCRPCAIHGGHRCPEKHFACMEKIHPFQVLEQVRQFL
jgi:heptosyltransferase II